MKHVLLIVVLAGIFGTSATTGGLAAPLSQDTTKNVFYIFGHIKNAGVYQITSDKMTLAEAIARAGGTTEQAGDRVRVIRMEDGKKVDFQAKLDDAILPGDTVLVEAAR